jgi:hypothetical protein
MFLITWMFDKLGYMPKIDMQIGKVNIEAAWPFPDVEEKPKAPTKKKPVVKKATTRKPRTKKA